MLNRYLLSAVLVVNITVPVFADVLPVKREQVGARISENIPAIPAQLSERLQQYQSTRGASFAGWLADGSILVTTRFAETEQVHRVAMPMGTREQITFYKEPVAATAVQPIKGGNGFVYGKDIGGSEFWQLFHYDLSARKSTLLTDGKRTRNESAVWSHDGKTLAYTSTARNGVDSDIWIKPLNGPAKAVVTEGGTWFANDFSPDGKKLPDCPLPQL